MKKALPLLAFVLLGTISCKKETVVEETIVTKKKFVEIEKANWFLGRWENNSQEGNLSETWEKINDSTFSAETYFVIKSDTVFSEKVTLEERNGELSYIVITPNQNNAQPVPFKLTQNTGQKLVFENPEHDYPNTIIYNQVGSDSLVAEIKGLKDGKEKNEFFRMKKK
ncbi:DUF6265 family protein [Flavobacterium sp. PLA-1-15]|uniref:DUF6265 family protein n=1 Tax=Flavobacterium sp. PLA-1-15 TaxID=3380533 RepID=UPI003B7D0E57